MAGRYDDPDGEPDRRRRPLRPSAAAPAPVDPAGGYLAEPIPYAEPVGDYDAARRQDAVARRQAELHRPAAASPAGGPPTQAVTGIVDTDGTPGGGGAGRDPAPLRYRVLPRSLLGIASMILAFSLGAALSGTILYSYYQYRLDQTNDRVNTLVDGYKHQFKNAEGDLQSAAASAKSAIQSELNASGKTETNPATQQALVRDLARSIYFVTTQNANGQTSVGTAFVVSSNSSETLLLTSYTTVQAATAAPGPSVYVRHDNSGTPTQVSVRTWDAGDDLALLVLPTGSQKPVKIAPSSPAPTIGQPVFAVAGDGSAGGSIAGGEIDDVSKSGIADDIPLGEAFQGAPIVNTSGQVIAVASRSYAPLGIPSGAVSYAPFVDAACQQVLTCPGGKLSSSS